MRKTAFILSILFISVFFYANGKQDGTSTAIEKEKKTDYIFMESQVDYELDRVGDYFMLMQLAHEMDPEEIYYKNELGYLMVILANRENINTAVFETGLSYMKEAFDRNPRDFYSAVRYATICQQLGFQDESLRAWAILKDLNPNKPEIAFNYAELLFQQGDTADLNKALDIYNQLERSQGRSLGITSQKVRTRIMLRDTAEALREIRDLIESTPKSSQNQLYFGDVFMAIGKPDSALIHYSKAIDMDSTNGLAYHRLAEYYQQINDSLGYDREVFNALSQSYLDVPVKIDLMRGYVQNLYADSTQRPRIEKLFEVLTTLHPLEADIHDLYSVYLAIIGDYKQAAEQTALCLDLNPAEITNWNRLITLYFTLDDYKSALNTSKEAMRFFPEDVTLKLMAASAFVNNEEADSAIVLLEEALQKTNPKELETLSDIETSLGDAFYKIGQPDSAFIHYDQALHYNPANLLAMNNSAYFLACEGRDLQRAEKLSYTTIHDQPDNPTYLDTYAWVMFKQKRFEEAKEYIDKTLERDNEPTAELYEHAGDIYFMNLMPAEAIEYWQQALELDPGNELLQQKIKEKRYINK